MTSRRTLLAGLISLPAALTGRKEAKTLITPAPAKPALSGGAAPRTATELSALKAGNVADDSDEVTFSDVGWGEDVNDVLSGSIAIRAVPSMAQAPMVAFTWGDTTQGTEGGFYINPVSEAIVLAPGTVITPTSPTSDTGWSIPEYWQTVAYSGNWEAAGTGTDLKYRLLPDNSVRVTGRLKLSSGSVSGSSTIATIPTGYIPARDEPLYSYAHVASSPDAEVSGYVLARAAGMFVFFGSFSTSDTLEIAGTYPLDA